MYWPAITACEVWSEKHTHAEPGGNFAVSWGEFSWYAMSDFMPSCSCSIRWSYSLRNDLVTCSACSSLACQRA
ncbi:hypothetical protein D3C72_1145610 [compost metagenome]